LEPNHLSWGIAAQPLSQ